jgi:class II lanthipeptide synthase
MLDHMDGAEIRREIEAGYATTLREGFGRNHSLCHGSIGNLEMLFLARRRLGIGTGNHDVHDLFDGILSEIEAGAWRCGHPKGVESIGLMTGLAGIGFGLLRLAFPDRVPSILLPESPSGRSSPICQDDDLSCARPTVAETPPYA